MLQRRLTLKQRKYRKQAQLRDIVYIFTIALILTGIYNSVALPFAKYIRMETGNIASSFQAEAKSMTTPKPTPTPIPSPTPVMIHYQDKRVSTLYAFLQSKGSPLANYAQDIVMDSDENGIDWTLLTAIAGKESGYGLYMPSNSFNAWGIGGADNLMYFRNWEDAISYEAHLLGSDYRLNADAGIQYKYCPTADCQASWAQDVSSFSEEILANK